MRIALSNFVRQLKYAVSRAVTIPVDVTTTPISFIPFTLLPSFLARAPADDAVERAFELDAEKFELTGRCAEALRIRHYATTVEQRNHAVLAIQQRLHLFVDPLHISAESFSKRHADRRRLCDVPAPSARDRKNVSSVARGPNSAPASCHASSRARSDAVSALPLARSAIAYGFISITSKKKHRCASPLIECKLLKSARPWSCLKAGVGRAYGRSIGPPAWSE